VNRWVRLRGRIDAASLSMSALRRFELELERLAQIDGQGFDPDEAVLIGHIVGELVENTDPAPFDLLWQHATLFLTACLTIAVADGRYSVEQARHISTLANSLGWSAAQLSELEAETLNHLAAKGVARLSAVSA
jgi:hypothetical protein